MKNVTEFLVGLLSLAVGMSYLLDGVRFNWRGAGIILALALGWFLVSVLIGAIRYQRIKRKGAELIAKAATPGGGGVL